MKTIPVLLIALSISLGITNCRPKQQQPISTDMVDIGGKKPPVMTFTEGLHDFGKITQGEHVKYAFKFKNTGGENLLITNAHGSCGCTIPEYPKEPIAPGSEGIINVEFNSEGKSGPQDKQVTLTTNCEPNTQTISIKADVLVPKTDAASDSH
jgi:hypothetical protein